MVATVLFICDDAWLAELGVYCLQRDMVHDAWLLDPGTMIPKRLGTINELSLRSWLEELYAVQSHRPDRTLPVELVLEKI
jgi:hypothetical protein